MSAAEESQKADTPKKLKIKVKDKNNDPSRFHGSGVNFKAKLIGVEEVLEPRGDRMCQEAMQKLKGLVKSAGEHKLRILINVSLEGLKILEEKSGNLCHHHAVHKISFIARDVTDARAFGYIYSPGDGKHKFFGIKTEKAAETLVLTLRDLFQVVFEMKKKEVEEAKRQKELCDNRENIKKEDQLDRTSIDSKDSSKSETPQQVRALSKYPVSGGTSKREKCVGNLLNLESELETLEQGLHQINVFGQQHYEGLPPPASPSDWSAGSDSWGNLSTPHSASLSASVSGSQTILHSHKDIHEGTLSAGAGFPTLPRPSHQTSPSSVSSMAWSGLAHRPRSIQSQGSFSTPPPKAAGWATFDSPSPPGLQSDTQVQASFEASFPGQLTSKTQIHSKLEAKLEAQAQSLSTAISDAMMLNTASRTLDTVQVSQHPFNIDPFFTDDPSFSARATPPSLVVDPMTNKGQSDAFTNDSQTSVLEKSDSSQTNNESNPFSDSVFEPSRYRTSPPDGCGSALNAAFASTPIQLSDKDQKTKDSFSNLLDCVEEANTETALKQTAMSKPTNLELGQDDKSVLAGACDPFGAVSPATEAKLNTSIGVSNDPFDTSSFLLPKSRGPLDLSQLKPVSLNQLGSQDHAGATSELSVVTEDENTSSLEPHIPSPKLPPPPLPTASPPDGPTAFPPPVVTAVADPSSPVFKQVTLGEAPPPPPRSIVSGHLRQQASVDTFEITPPPIPKRPPVAAGSSPKLLRQSTIHFPVEADAPPPPPPPPRPGMTNAEKPKLGLIGRTESLGSNGPPPPPPPRPATKSNDLSNADTALNKSKFSSATTRTSISPIPRPRPRPRSKTPANTSSGLSVVEDITISNAERPSSAAELRDPFGEHHFSFGKGSTQASYFDSGSQDLVSQPPTVSTVKQEIPDPFAEVDPFANNELSDPFCDMPDPFTMDSPMDPFSSDFKGELFTTKAVTVNTSDTSKVEKNLVPMDKGNYSGSVADKQDNLFCNNSHGSYGETTLRTDTSLEASMSLPFAYSTDSNTHSSVNESSHLQNGQSGPTQNDSDLKKPDPFEFDVFSSDFFKNQFNNSGTKASISWMSAGDGVVAPATKTVDNSTGGLPSDVERVSPGLTPSSVPNSSNKDGDSSSNSEIADAFGDEGVAHQMTHVTLGENQSQAQASNIFGNPFT